MYTYVYMLHLLNTIILNLDDRINIGQQPIREAMIDITLIKLYL